MPALLGRIGDIAARHPWHGSGCAAASGRGQHPPNPLEAVMSNTPCVPTSGPGIADPEWPPAGQNLRDVALQLRLLLRSGTPFAIATVVGAYGTMLRQPGTVLVISESGETIGYSPAGPLDGAMRDLATEVLATGHDRLEWLEIDQDAASYIGLSGGASLDVHATRVSASDPAFGSALCYLDSGAATVLVTGTCGVSGHAVIGPDRITGRLSWPGLPAPVINDARSMLGRCHTARRTYYLDGQRPRVSIQVWMQSHPEIDALAPEILIQSFQASTPEPTPLWHRAHRVKTTDVAV